MALIFIYELVFRHNLILNMLHDYIFVIESIFCHYLGKLELLDLTGNISCEQYADHDEFQVNGKCILRFGSSFSSTIPYDDDP